MCVFCGQQLQTSSLNYMRVAATSMTRKVPGAAKPAGPEQQWRVDFDDRRHISGRCTAAGRTPHQACTRPAILQLSLALDGAHDARTVPRLPPALVCLHDIWNLSRHQRCYLGSCRSKGTAEAA